MQEYLDFAARHPFLVGAAAALAVMILVTELRRATRRWREVGAAEAVRLMNQEAATVVDVREPGEASGGAIPHARRVALSALPAAAAELAAGPVIAYCGNGARSPRACRLLARAGAGPVYNLKGGLGAWREAGMPLEASP